VDAATWRRPLESYSQINSATGASKLGLQSGAQATTAAFDILATPANAQGNYIYHQNTRHLSTACSLSQLYHVRSCKGMEIGTDRPIDARGIGVDFNREVGSVENGQREW
jgi:hypothetical protein